MAATKKSKTKQIKKTQEPPETIIAVPSVDSNAALEIEKITKPLDIPVVDKNASLRIDKVEEKEESVPQEKFNDRLYIFGVIALGVIIFSTVALFVLYSQQANQVNQPAKESSVVPTAAPEQVLKREEWTFEVLNGSRTAGVAKKAADKLEALGYKVVGIGNADSSSSVGNRLYVSHDMSDKQDLLVADLKTDFNISSVSGVLAGSTASARIILGK